MMNPREPQFEELLPIELKLRLLEAELERLDSDVAWIEQRRKEVLGEMKYYEQLLSSSRRRVLRLIK